VLGGDTPLGIALILDLEKNGYIVITSVSTPEAVDEIEQQSHGYVRAIVLDPTEVCPVASCPRISTNFLYNSQRLFRTSSARFRPP
jgi:hypothetical protein